MRSRPSQIVPQIVNKNGAQISAKTHRPDRFESGSRHSEQFKQGPVRPTNGRMPSRRVTEQFFAALFLLLAALAAVGILGFHGITTVNHANDQVFADNFLSAEATNRVSGDLELAERQALEITNATDINTVARVRAQLRDIVIPQVNRDIAALARIHVDAGDDRQELRQIGLIRDNWQAFLNRSGHDAIASAGAIPSAARREADAKMIASTLDPLNGYVTARRSREVREAAVAHKDAQATFQDSRTWLIVAAIVAILAALAMIQVGLALRRLVNRATDERDHGESASEYIDILQVTETEDEAQELLRRHTERSIEGSRAIVLGRNNSDDRLEPKTSLEPSCPSCANRSSEATPRSCLAVRFSRGHDESPQRPRS